MKWTCGAGRDTHIARCGHLYVRIERNPPYKTPDDPAYEAESYAWFVEPDDEDKSYRRALATGLEPTLGEAKKAVVVACVKLVEAMQADLGE